MKDETDIVIDRDSIEKAGLTNLLFLGSGRVLPEEVLVISHCYQIWEHVNLAIRRPEEDQKSWFSLDWELPGLSGLDICRKLRLSGNTTPVLMLTGRAGIVDKEAGLEGSRFGLLNTPTRNTLPLLLLPVPGC